MRACSVLVAQRLFVLARGRRGARRKMGARRGGGLGFEVGRLANESSRRVVRRDETRRVAECGAETGRGKGDEWDAGWTLQGERC